LFKSNFKSLCVVAVRYVKDDDIARDIVQETFFNLWQKKETIDLSKSVKSYLVSAVRNRSLNYIRDNRKFSDTGPESGELFPKSGYVQADRLVEEEIRKKISLSISELPEKCREVFVLNRYDNLKYQQIADKLGISLKTVESQMTKALKHLRIRLAEYISFVWIFLITKWFL
jgi:RNA polymerase sigma-70 factor, ECF subfamily